MRSKPRLLLLLLTLATAIVLSVDATALATPPAPEVPADDGSTTTTVPVPVDTETQTASPDSDQAAGETQNLPPAQDNQLPVPTEQAGAEVTPPVDDSPIVPPCDADAPPGSPTACTSTPVCPPDGSGDPALCPVEVCPSDASGDPGVCPLEVCPPDTTGDGAGSESTTCTTCPADGSGDPAICPPPACPADGSGDPADCPPPACPPDGSGDPADCPPPACPPDGTDGESATTCVPCPPDTEPTSDGECTTPVPPTSSPTEPVSTTTPQSRPPTPDLPTAPPPDRPAIWNPPKIEALADIAQPPICAVGTGPLKEGTYNVSSPYGLRGSEFHRGMDLAAREGTPIYAAMDGVVVQSGPASGFGNWIVIDSRTATGVVSTVYGHMYADGLRVNVNQVVKAGQHIADVGNDGQSSGAHLHFEVWEGGRLQGGKAVDPKPVLQGSNGDGSTKPVVALTESVGDCAVGKGLDTSKVPPEYVQWLLLAGGVCPGISAPLLAAQIEQESGFRDARSPAGAQGPAQFMPGTWANSGVDGDKDGDRDVHSVPDAVISQGHLMCDNYDATNSGTTQGTLQGDPVSLALAAYNAGLGAVQEARGMPSGGQYTTETQPYVKRIRERERYFATELQGADPQAPTATPQADEKLSELVALYDLTRYVWGGGNADGPTHGGFDSPGLTTHLAYELSDGRTTLPRTVQQQWRIGREVPIGEARPGDLFFTGFDPSGNPEHVGVVLPGGNVVHATIDGGTRQDAIPPDARIRRIG